MTLRRRKRQKVTHGTGWKKAEKALDKIFSQYIRLRDRIPGSEYGVCCTCRVKRRRKYMDAGHFITRNHYSTRWSEENVHLQCKLCNGPKGGQQYAMSQYINKKLGSGTAERLEVQGNQFADFAQFELEAMTEEYKKQVKIMLKNDYIL